MELKRILARDIRAANEKAVAQYGPDVLVISSGQVNGLTELIVAIDLAPMSTEEADPFLKTEYVSTAKPSGKFDVLLGQTLEQNKREARERQATKVAKPIVEVASKPAAAKAKPAAKMATKPVDEVAQRDAQEHDTLRGREIVALVREELASLRREFKLGQQMAAWQQGGMPLPAAIAPLRDALNDAPIPVALSALLIDSIKDHSTLADAMGALSRQLSHAVEQHQISAPVSGVHALAGPSGAGKSMMIARLAQHAALQIGSEKVMVISFHDQRAGAWNQTQLLCAQSGVDSFRATNASTLKLLLPWVAPPWLEYVGALPKCAEVTAARTRWLTEHPEALGDGGRRFLEHARAGRAVYTWRIDDDAHAALLADEAAAPLERVCDVLNWDQDESNLTLMAAERATRFGVRWKEGVL
jgi:flagellar biosynthesis GTPase FlhF